MLKPKFSQSFIFIGMFAAELLVKKAVIPLSLKHLKSRGYGFFFNNVKTINGSIIKAQTSIHPTNKSNNLP